MRICASEKGYVVRETEKKPLPFVVERSGEVVGHFFREKPATLILLLFIKQDDAKFFPEGRLVYVTDEFNVRHYDDGWYRLFDNSTGQLVEEHVALKAASARAYDLTAERVTKYVEEVEIAQRIMAGVGAKTGAFKSTTPSDPLSLLAHSADFQLMREKAVSSSDMKMSIVRRSDDSGITYMIGIDLFGDDGRLAAYVDLDMDQAREVARSLLGALEVSAHLKAMDAAPATGAKH